jgi:ribosome-binding factor A
MGGKRTDKISGLLQEELSSIFLTHGSQWWGNHFITISGIKVTPDLAEAWIYLSMFQEKNRTAIMKSIEFHAKDIRHELARKIKNQVRTIPVLKFFLDETLDEVNRMEKLLKSIDIPKEETRINDDDYKK